MSKKVLIPLVIVVIAVIGVACLLSGVAKVNSDTEHANVLDLLSQDPPSEIYVYALKGGYPQEIKFSDSSMIQELHNTMKDKTTTRQSDKMNSKDKVVLTMNYFINGDTIYIGNDGRIFISYNMASIRNKSRLHWLWWKLNGSKVYMIYATEPDAKVLELAKKITTLVAK